MSGWTKLTIVGSSDLDGDTDDEERERDEVGGSESKLARDHACSQSTDER
jgi:hypothetical protein